MQEIIEVGKIDISTINERNIESDSSLATARIIEIKNLDDLNKCSVTIKTLKDNLKNLDKERLELTAGLRETAEKINSKYEQPKKLLNEAILILNKKVIAFTEKVEAIRREEIKKQEEAKRKEIEALEKRAEKAKTESKKEELLEKANDIANFSAPKQVVEAPKAKGLTILTTYDFEVTDINLVPENYCEKVVLRQAIIGYIRSTSGQKPIAGIKIIEKKSTVSR